MNLYAESSQYRFQQYHSKNHRINWFIRLDNIVGCHSPILNNKTWTKLVVIPFAIDMDDQFPGKKTTNSQNTNKSGIVSDCHSGVGQPVCNLRYRDQSAKSDRGHLGNLSFFRIGAVI